MWGGCLDGVGMLSGGSGKTLDCVGSLCGCCGEADWRMWGDCLEGMGS